jgi:predicted anti-sigma-YlaC factor YlaD
LQSQCRHLSVICKTKETENSRRGIYQQSIRKQANQQEEKEKVQYVPPAAADIVFSRSVTACSRWRCSLLASVKAFFAFFALDSVDLVDFSALTLAAVAASKAFREALSSASSDEMRALAAAKASAVQ